MECQPTGDQEGGQRDEEGRQLVAGDEYPVGYADQRADGDRRGERRHQTVGAQVDGDDATECGHGSY